MRKLPLTDAEKAARRAEYREDEARHPNPKKRVHTPEEFAASRLSCG